ncbi:protein translocase subunit SecF [Marinicauda algicola]|uniref:Protein-export membrane protein SecF n=1 Tax=Marinicauda algicola TaxID=2029849 RepID=A0A4S2GZE0_9PROT|nr:protein translocase subunit SecF [Marinicauda algicola]TGY88575.1 protein translocase subunit SecF [Marinicauda algicola]
MKIALIRFFPVETKFRFIRLRFAAFAISLALMIGSIAAFFAIGLNFGIDFRGGTLIEVQTEGPADLGAIRSTLNGLGLADINVQGFGGADEVLITVGTMEPEAVRALPPPAGRDAWPEDLDAEAAQQGVRAVVQAELSQAFPGIEYRRLEVVGPQVSGELVEKGVMAVLAALFLMLVYIWFRFEWQYSIGAVLALTHDVVATIGFFAVTQMEFNLSTIAAILTIVGYSMNDTVVVYDRIREELRKYKTMPLPEVLDKAINQTLSRTFMTSGTTLVALVAMATIGGAALQGFAVALIWGILIGTYSSVFVGAPLLMLTGVKRSSEEDEEA